ncbi:hypothetical protein CTAYLR_004038 [Chrysophaeum taylorii]|uniref:Tetratricopeptide repeat protein n=1 Tax=Chrysophaeum taylorii TaxID=2483200 RepID=A0AAD7U795_9STRA|nr:hypothetical protein CTAYLR_004038 [Chrysophaeum taylorii]
MDEGWPIRTSGAAWMLAEPWRKPAAFGRAWCLNECFLTVRCEKKLELIMPPTEARDFEKSLVEDFNSRSCPKSTCKTPQRKRTRYVFSRPSGNPALVSWTVNQLVIGQLREWFAKTGRAALDRLPPGEREVSPLIVSLALLLRDQAMYDEARGLLEDALDAYTKLFGSEHENVATVLNNHLAAVLESQGKLEEAETLYRRAIEIGKVTLGENHPDLATWLNNLGVLLHDQGKLEEAEPLLRRALEIDEETLGPSHPEVATDLSNLAAFMSNQV